MRGLMALLILMIGLAPLACQNSSLMKGRAEVAQSGLHVQPIVEPEDVTDIEGVEPKFARVGNLYISGQPSAEAFEEFKRRGVTTVINLRTQREMDNREYVPFDEEEKLRELGIRYVHIPLGGQNEYTPEAVDQFALALSEIDGKGLLHCTVAWRASHLYAAYLVRYKGWPADKAYRFGKAIGGIDRMPFEKFLDKDMYVTLR